jgi:hypothetical protein
MTKFGQNAEFQAVEDGRYRAEEEDLTGWCVSLC